MTVAARIAVVVALHCAACGRLGFDETSAHDATNDATSARDAISRSCLDAPGVLFCDGFEAPDLDAWTETEGPVMRQTTIVHSGTGALRTSSNAAHIGSAVSRSLPEIVSGSHHIRGWFYLPSGFAIVKINLMGSANATADGVLFLLDLAELRAYAAPGGGATVTTGVMVPRDRWFCVELHIGVATNGSIALDLDGAEIGRATSVATLPVGNITGFNVGPSFVETNQEPVTIYIDDVVTGTQPIGCS